MLCALSQHLLTTFCIVREYWIVGLGRVLWFFEYIARSDTMDLSVIITELLVSLVGIFVGTLLAMAVERRNARRRKQHRAKIILRALADELYDNDESLMAVRPAYEETVWGKSFYVSTTAWETAVASGDLPDIIGFELADLIGAQYGLLVQLRYYVNLLTQLWFAPTTIDGYEHIQQGFRDTILDIMTRSLDRYPHVMDEIQDALNGSPNDN